MEWALPGSMFGDYQRAQGLADTTIRNRRSILITLANKSGPLATCDVFTLRRYVGREDVSAGTRRTVRGALVAFYTFLHAEGLREDNPMHASLATTQIYTGVSEWRKQLGIRARPSLTIPTQSGRRAA